ncbi:MAG: sugar phosphate isomerase/epimerase [Lachnospiraceae bacterium]|nr:sugar phosphate isomerase/epimerase [Lachnospiraceae bacterium]
MKLSVAVAGKDALQSAFVVWRGFEDSIRKAKAYGYDGVELALRSASDISVSALDRYLSDNEMEVSCVSTGQVFAADHLYFTHPDEAVRKRCVSVFRELVDLASNYCGLVNVGRVRGFIEEGRDEEYASALFCETAAPICEYAAKKGVDIIIEPVNRYEINFVNNVEQGARLLSRLGFENAGLMPDVFHMNIEDARIGEALVRNGQYVKYIHLADSNRLAPGQGHLNFDEVFDALHTIGYDGWASVEIFPVPTPDIAAKQAADFLLPYIRK